MQTITLDIQIAAAINRELHRCILNDADFARVKPLIHALETAPVSDSENNIVPICEAE